MSSVDTNEAPKRRVPWVLIAVAVLTVFLLIASNLGGGESKSARYNRLSQEALALSESALKAWQMHEPLNDTDKSNLQKAAAKAEEMLQVDPRSWHAHGIAALNYSALEEWDRAMPHIEYDLKNLPNPMSPEDMSTTGELHYLDSQALFFRNKPADAENAASEAIKIANDPNFYYARAQARAQQHKLEAAESDLREVLKLVPDDSRALSLLKFISNMK